MNRYDRLGKITKLINQEGTTRINEVVEDLSVSGITVCHDLAGLEGRGSPTKIHGGARSSSASQIKEGSHQEKRIENIEGKHAAAKKAVNLIEEDDTIFLGPGTAIELLAQLVERESLVVIMNCFPVFQILFKKRSLNSRVYLSSGEVREPTKSLIDRMTNMLLKTRRFSKMFFGCSGVKGTDVFTSTTDEAYARQLALHRPLEKYLSISTSRIGKGGFTQPCHLKDLAAVVVDKNDEDSVQKLGTCTETMH